MLGDQLHLSVQTEDRLFSLNCYLAASQSLWLRTRTLESEKQLSQSSKQCTFSVNSVKEIQYQMPFMYHILNYAYSLLTFAVFI